MLKTNDVDIPMSMSGCGQWGPICWNIGIRLLLDRLPVCFRGPSNKVHEHRPVLLSVAGQDVIVSVIEEVGADDAPAAYDTSSCCFRWAKWCLCHHTRNSSGSKYHSSVIGLAIQVEVASFLYHTWLTRPGLCRHILTNHVQKRFRRACMLLPWPSAKWTS